MIIQTYAAESAAAALKMVRTELGPDAVVLKTRELPLGRGPERIEITACADKVKATETPRPATPASTTPRQVVRASFPQAETPRPTIPQTITRPTPKELPAPTVSLERIDRLEQKVDRILSLLANSSAVMPHQEIRAKLTDRDLPETFVNELVTSANSSSSSIRTTLTDALTSIMLPGLTIQPGESVAVIGYAGAGKTSALGKLAAKLVFQEKQSIRLVTLDSIKIGAYEELSSYAEILGSQAIDFATAQTTLDDKSVTLIDTPAFPKQAGQLVALREQLDALNPTYRFAVISALTRTTDVVLIMQQLAQFAPTHLVFTMLDLTERWGSAIAASRTSHLPICFLTAAPAGIGTVNAPDPAAFTKMFLTEEQHA
jgi:flagellar biosynthesis protein FlhF